MKQHTYGTRLLAALLAVYAAWSMCRTAGALMAETRRTELLRQRLETATAEGAGESPLPLGVRAWQQLGMVAPGDTVFFDAGT